ncbi:FkbM family methyltransferase [Pseudomonas sp. N040]|uniref:FkbM family methyltransferase n=1 Tax=Pseudomonas sp. N040 TaxID=2785325 RepID=UPI0018A2E8ED|nr:FkbM family methyltransferase [Pseudomonas sp. N040]MBF7728997.1 FkbM family methyltransferase [Pseudomonas sp. N040]MBW7012637.1 FkbM family methyltransferase [Pseudomonas sp. N040]
MTHNSDTCSISLTLDELRRQLARLTPDSPALMGWASYAQCDEDGIIRDCLGRIARMVELSNSFVEIGCGDGQQNNTHQLLLDGYRGIWVDADEAAINAVDLALGGLAFDDLLVLHQRVSLAIAPALARRMTVFLQVASVDLLSLDIDGNDLHVLPDFVRSLTPKLVCVEYNAKFPPPTRQVMAYDDAHGWAYDDYFGASLQSWVEALQALGYCLVACSLSGANAFFVRDDLIAGFTRYPVEALYQPPRYWLAGARHGHPASLKWLAQRLRQATSSFRMVTVQPPELPPSRFAIHQAQDEFISGDLARSGIWEPFESRVFSRLCAASSQVLDLGANIGWYSLLAVRYLGENGRVIAFEPDAVNARLLRVNAATGDHRACIEIHQAAVSDREGELSLYQSATNLGDHRLFLDEEARDCCLVPVTTLDSFFDGCEGPLPDLVKSDTQGSEARIFRGAAGLLAQGWRPTWILEFWPFGLTRSGDDPATFWRQLDELGYLTFEVAENNPVLVLLTEERLQRRLNEDLSPRSWGFINLLCIPRESAMIERVRDLMQGESGGQPG